jgi:hypothetical protein
MPISILHSVGRDGINRQDDVRAVQGLLNGIAIQLGLQPLPVNGTVSPAMITAILEAQRKIARLPRPDGRVDPHGNTLRALNAAAAAGGAAAAVTVGAAVAALAAGAAAGAVASVAAGTGGVTYKTDVPAAARLVSAYGIKVIEKAIDAAGMNAAVITSTLRLPAEQAAIMYRNAVQNLTGQYKLYGSTGDEVLDVYAANKAKPKAEVVELMKNKIEELANKGKRVSNHVTTVERYALLNIVDIGVGSTRTAAGATFNLAKLTEAFRKLEKDGYIKKFIDETAKTNQCWHLEIVPNAKPLP